MEKFVELDCCIPSSDIKDIEEKYHEQLLVGKVTTQLQFEYAWCLVQSCFPGDIHKAILLLEDLESKADCELSVKRDYYFYLALGFARLKDFCKALVQLKKLLEIEPRNHQANELQCYISKKLRKERMSKALVAGGIALGVGGVLGAVATGAAQLGILAVIRAAPTVAQVVPILFKFVRK